MTLSLAGGAILGAEIAGRPLLAPTESPGLATRRHGREACFPMLPFCGRIEHNGFAFRSKDYRLSRNTSDPLVLHGDGWLRDWSLASCSDTQADLLLDVAASEASPFSYRAEQRVVVLPDGLELVLSVQNRGTETLPFGLGFHPYLPVEPGTAVEFDAEAVWSERALHLPGRPGLPGKDLDFTRPRPVPSIWINNAFEAWPGKAIIHQPDGARLVLKAGSLLNWLMVYKPEGETAFLCLEPMSHRPAAHADADTEPGGLIVLAPGEQLSGSMMLRFLPE